MPKRVNPFEDEYFPMQAKIRVNSKHVNMGVESASKMRAVYEYTKELLTKGALAMKNKVVSAEDNGMVICETEQNLGKDNGYKQLQLDSNGRLNKSLGLTSNSQLVNPRRNICYFCEKPLAVYQTYNCSVCHEIFCSLCSVPTYCSDNPNAAECLTCAK